MEFAYVTLEINNKNLFMQGTDLMKYPWIEDTYQKIILRLFQNAEKTNTHLPLSMAIIFFSWVKFWID